MIITVSLFSLVCLYQASQFLLIAVSVTIALGTAVATTKSSKVGFAVFSKFNQIGQIQAWAEFEPKVKTF